jgi:hypothetical protein
MATHLDFTSAHDALSERIQQVSYRNMLDAHGPETGRRIVAETKAWRCNVAELGWDTADLLDKSMDHGTFDITVTYQELGIWDATDLRVYGNHQLAETLADAITARYPHSEYDIRQVDK